jgi:hypothetical protein
MVNLKGFRMLFTMLPQQLAEESNGTFRASICGLSFETWSSQIAIFGNICTPVLCAWIVTDAFRVYN